MKMTYIAVASAALLGLAACEGQIDSPKAPAPDSGPITPSDSLSGTYNLRATECGNQNSETRLVIQGNKFDFYGSSCTVAEVHNDRVNTRVTLSCTGEGQNRNRIVNLQTRPGELRLIEDQTTLTYFQCESQAGTLAPAAADEAAAAAAAEVM